MEGTGITEVNISSIKSLFTGCFSINFGSGLPLPLTCIHPSSNSPDTRHSHPSLWRTDVKCYSTVLHVSSSWRAMYAITPSPACLISHPALSPYPTQLDSGSSLNTLWPPAFCIRALEHGIFFSQKVSPSLLLPFCLHQTSIHQGCLSSLPVVVRGLPVNPISCYSCLCVTLSPVTSNQ